MTNPPLVSPVVTDEMVDAAFQVMVKSGFVPDHSCDEIRFWYALQKAITAALEASGELERLRAALQNIRAIAAKSQHEGGPDGILKTIEEFAVYGLEGKNP